MDELIDLPLMDLRLLEDFEHAQQELVSTIVPVVPTPVSHQEIVYHASNDDVPKRSLPYSNNGILKSIGHDVFWGP